MRIDQTNFVLNCLLDQAAKYLNDSLTILDLFCGEGENASNVLVTAGEYTGLELDPQKAEITRSKFPKACIRNIDSIRWISDVEPFDELYNVILIDNPLCIFGDDHQYCEHFDLIRHLWKILDKKSVLILDVVPKPYDAFASKNVKWIKQRNEFYSVSNSSEIDLAYLSSFYNTVFTSYGIDVAGNIQVCREYNSSIDYFYFFYFELINKKVPK